MEIAETETSTISPEPNGGDQPNSLCHKLKPCAQHGKDQAAHGDPLAVVALKLTFLFPFLCAAKKKLVHFSSLLFFSLIRTKQTREGAPPFLFFQLSCYSCLWAVTT
jgi:hypothetical protein